MYHYHKACECPKVFAETHHFDDIRNAVVAVSCAMNDEGD
jgi:hypothetical protein